MDRIANELRIEVIDLAKQQMSAFDYEHKNRHDDFEPLIHHVLEFEQIIFASPVYWYAVSSPMKVFLDRISDLLEVPELLAKGRQLRGKTAFVLCTSIEDEVSPTFLNGLRETINYLGMRYGGLIHANCRDGYLASRYEDDVSAFVSQLKGLACKRPD